MDERDYYSEKAGGQDRRPTPVRGAGRVLNSRYAGCEGRKKRELPRGASELDRAKFAKALDYMVRIDDMLTVRIRVAAVSSSFQIRRRWSPF
jgi:hypothetical protein